MPAITGENHENSLSEVGVLSDNRTEHLPNTNPECYLYTNLLGLKCKEAVTLKIRS
jgi:hypothetical protein